MKTINDVLLLINQAIQNNQATYDKELRPQWFLHYHGHVNQITVDYYLTGWERGEESSALKDSCRINLQYDEQVQELYWFVKNRL